MVEFADVFETSAKWIAEIAARPEPVAQGMSRWFDYCASAAPKKKALWSRLRKLDFEADAERLSDWLQHTLTSEPPPKAINGLWFGLFNPCDETRDGSSQVYLGGSKGFDPRSKSNEWVCQLSYRPRGQYANSEVLPEIYRRVKSPEDDGLMYLGEPFLSHGYLALVVSNWCRGPQRALLLGNVPKRAIVMGHDSGDFYRLAVLQAKS
ncbi:MAG: hypothetical protein JSS02_04885 [Planctomycetes bacterium]|nr:hypothetical protein [Planctomycetota bacterium]